MERNMYVTVSLLLTLVALVVVYLLLGRNKREDIDQARFRIKDWGYVHVATDEERQRNRRWAESLGGNNDHLH